MSAIDRHLLNLDAGFQRTLDALVRAAADNRSPLRWPVLATQAATGGGSARVVVLRSFDRASYRCAIWTDARSAKVRELKAAPEACLLFFNPAKKLQIRAIGTVSVLQAGAEHDAALQSAMTGSMADYASVAGPGQPVEHPDNAPEADEAGTNFTLLSLAAQRFDVLELSRDGHRRAVFEVDGEDIQSSWRIP